MDWQKEAEKMRQAMQDHKQKMESDPAYRKQYEETSKRLEEHIPILKYWKEHE